jgi:TonB-dependent receptor
MALVAGFCACAVPGIANAAEPVEAGSSDQIVVTAARAAGTAREEQLAAPNLIDVQSAETIAKYPDVNAAEALSRIPGVSLSIDTAEGRFVNIRGIDGNLNGASFGGVVLLNTQPGGTYFNSSGRAVEFDTVPIGAIDRISVTKTGLPDHEAEGIGGSVELTPRTAIGAKALFADLTLGGGIESFKGKGLYRDEVVIGGPLGGKNDAGENVLSFVASQFLYNDSRSFDDIEAAYVDDPAVAPNKAFAALELRKYDYHRQRFGYSGEVDFTPAAGQRFYLRGSMAGYNEHVSRNRLEIDFNGDTTINPANKNGFIATATNGVKTLRDEDETHRNLVLQAGGDNHLGAAHIEYFAAYSRATYDKHYDYNSTFENPSDYVSAYDNTTNPDVPAFAITSGTGFTNPANYFLTKISNAVEHDRDREYSYAGSVALPVGLTAGDEIKVGAKLRYREKIAGSTTVRFKYTGAPLALSSDAVGGSITDFYRAGYDIGPYIGASALRAVFDGAKGAVPFTAGSQFDDIEDVTAGFAQYHGTFGQFGVLAGVRFEHTKAIYNGFGDQVINGAVVTGPLSTHASYDNAFPTLQLRYQAMPRLVLRATYSTGLARPGFFQTQQSTSIDVGAGAVSTGNPNLKPTYSNNFDASIQYALPDSGVISLGGFDKELRNYIATRTIRGTFPGIQGIATIATYQNLSGGHARGIEGNLVDKFSNMPGLLGGLGIDANLTYVDSAVTLRDGEGQVALPGTFKWSWNAAGFYERGPVKARISAQFESTVLFGIGGSRATDVFQDSRLTLDFNASYDVRRGVQFYFNAKNLTNAPLRFYEGAPNRPIQREFYDATFEAGVKIHF